VLGFNLEGSGSQDGTVTVDIGGLMFTVSTGSGQSVSSVLSGLEAAIDPDPTYDADVFGNELRIFGSVLGNDYSVFVSDVVPNDPGGFSYGFSVESFPVATPEPSTLVLLAAAALGGWARRRRVAAHSV
jgi:hypothetical protein